MSAKTVVGDPLHDMTISKAMGTALGKLTSAEYLKRPFTSDEAVAFMDKYSRRYDRPGRSSGSTLQVVFSIPRIGFGKGVLRKRGWRKVLPENDLQIGTAYVDQFIAAARR